MTGLPPRPRVLWAIYAWPGNRWLVTTWATTPGTAEEHGPLQWAGSLEAARALVGAGLSRHDPMPEDADRNPALVETWE